MRGLYIPKELLITASGIEKRIVEADIRQGKLILDEKDEIWFHIALVYVSEKWKAGTLMYPPYCDDVGRSFPARVLSLLDDQMSAGNLELNWKHPYK